MFGIEVLILAHSVGNAHVIKQEQEDITKLNRKIIIAKNNEQISSLKQKIMNKLIGKTKNVYKKSLYFEINSSVPIEDNTYIQLKNINYSKVKTIVIDGYASSPGSDKYNLILSYKRIDSVVHIFRRLGYKKEIQTIPHGEDCLMSKKNEECQRVDIQFFY